MKRFFLLVAALLSGCVHDDATSARSPRAPATYRVVSATCQRCRFEDWIHDTDGLPDCGVARSKDDTPAVKRCVGDALAGGRAFRATFGDVRAKAWDEVHVVASTVDGGVEAFQYFSGPPRGCGGVVVRVPMRPEPFPPALAERLGPLGSMMWEMRESRLSCKDEWRVTPPGPPRPVAELSCEEHQLDGWSGCRIGPRSLGFSPASWGPDLLCAVYGDAGMNCAPASTALGGEPELRPATSTWNGWMMPPCVGARLVSLDGGQIWARTSPDGGLVGCPGVPHLFDPPGCCKAEGDDL